MTLELAFWLNREKGILFSPSLASKGFVDDLPPFLEGPISEHKVLRYWFVYEPPTIDYLDDWSISDRFCSQVEEQDSFAEIEQEGHEDAFGFFLQTHHPFARVCPKQGVRLLLLDFLYESFDSYQMLFVVYSEITKEAYRILVNCIAGGEDDDIPYDTVYAIEEIRPLDRVELCLKNDDAVL